MFPEPDQQQPQVYHSISPVVAMVKNTTLLVLGIALAVFSYPANNSRVWSRIPMRNQFDQLGRNQLEGVATPQGVRRNNDLRFRRFDRIYKRTKADTPGQIEIDKESKSFKKIQSIVRAFRG